jgi:hypothetical protein
MVPLKAVDLAPGAVERDRRLVRFFSTLSCSASTDRRDSSASLTLLLDLACLGGGVILELAAAHGQLRCCRRRPVPSPPSCFCWSAVSRLIIASSGPRFCVCRLRAVAVIGQLENRARLPAAPLHHLVEQLANEAERINLGRRASRPTGSKLLRRSPRPTARFSRSKCHRAPCGLGSSGRAPPCRRALGIARGSRRRGARIRFSRNGPTRT